MTAIETGLTVLAFVFRGLEDTFDDGPPTQT